MMRSLSIFASLAAAAAVAAPAVSQAHGVTVGATVVEEVRVERRVEVRASYHSGRPMAAARAAVYAPGSGDEPWLTGACADDGSFSFEPPPGKGGEWTVRVTDRGHAGVVTIALPPPGGDGAGAPARSEVRAEASSAPHLSTLQRVLMGACVIWGLVGTALFFSRRSG